MSPDRGEIVAARAIGVGMGLIALMVSWLIGSRLAELAWEAPVGPTVAFTTAVAIGVMTAVVAGRRLVLRVRDEQAFDDLHDERSVDRREAPHPTA